MRTALYKVTTLKGKSVIKPPKDTTNKLFYYLYFNTLLLTENGERQLNQKYRQI